MKKLKEKIYVMLVCIVLGIMISFQFSVSDNPQEKYRTKQFSELVNELENLKKENSQLNLKANDYQAKYEGIEQSAAGESKIVENMKNEIDNLNVLSGVTDVFGVGVTISISVPKEIQLNNPDIDYLSNIQLCLWEITNDLNSIGAEAISINDERYVSRTQLIVVGASIKINDSKFSPFEQFTIKAIGNPKLLESAFKIPGNSIEYYKSLGLDIKMTKSDKVEILKYSKSLNNKYIRRKGDK